MRLFICYILPDTYWVSLGSFVNKDKTTFKVRKGCSSQGTNDVTEKMN